MMPAIFKSFLKLFFLFAAIIMLTRCSNFPKDPNHSFENARKNGLRVGIAINPPFTMIQNGNIAGTEVTLIENFARQNGLKINYTVAAESELISQLEKYRLHLVAGGFDKKTIWTSKAGLSTPYDGQHILLVPKGENKLLYKLEQYIYEVR